MSTKLLKAKFNGLANFPAEGLTIDFLPQSNVNHDEYILSRDFVVLADNLYYPKVMIVTGANATGKSAILELLYCAFDLATNSFKHEYNFAPLIKSRLEINLLFFDNGLLKQLFYTITPSKGKLVYQLNGYYTKEYLGRKKSTIYQFEHDKNLADSLPHGMMSVGEPIGTKITFNTINPTLYYFTPANINLTPTSIELYKDDMDNGLLELLIKVLDNNIEKFAYRDGRFSLKFFGMVMENGLTAPSLFNMLSDGTKKVLILFFMVINVLKDGGTIIIDEIENHLNKSIVDLIIDLFQDKRVNKNSANIVFSTHYAELLDEVNRTDAILITDSENGQLVINNAYNILKGKSRQRKELKKSKLYISGLLNSKPHYDKVISFKVAMENTIRGE